MKSFLKLGLAIFFITSSVALNAQDQTPRATSAEVMANELTRFEVDQLKLDAKQAKDLKEINFLYAESLLELRKKAGKENSKTEEKALRRSHNLKIRSILSSEKYQQYLALKREERKEEKDK